MWRQSCTKKTTLLWSSDLLTLTPQLKDPPLYKTFMSEIFIFPKKAIHIGAKIPYDYTCRGYLGKRTYIQFCTVFISLYPVNF